jgi:hypothetical protein
MNPSLVPNCRETDNPRVICPGLRVPEFQTARSKQLKIHEGGDFTLDDTDSGAASKKVKIRAV